MYIHQEQDFPPRTGQDVVADASEYVRVASALAPAVNYPHTAAFDHQVDFGSGFPKEGDRAGHKPCYCIDVERHLFHRQLWRSLQGIRTDKRMF